MSSFNKVILMGNLTRDPEVKYTQSGTAICSFSLALNERYKARDGEWTERTSFIDCTIWDKRGEAFAKFHKKGSKAFVEGALKQESWEDKESGDKRSKIGVTVFNWEFVGSGEKKDGGDRQQERNATADAEPASKYKGDERYGQTDDYGPEDTPF